VCVHCLQDTSAREPVRSSCPSCVSHLFTSSSCVSPHHEVCFSSSSSYVHVVTELMAFPRIARQCILHESASRLPPPPLALFAGETLRAASFAFAADARSLARAKLALDVLASSCAMSILALDSAASFLHVAAADRASTASFLDVANADWLLCTRAWAYDACFLHLADCPSASTV
jgi:hypothetical protein